MSSTPLRCRLGLHSWVQAHPPDERLQGPDHKTCRRCHQETGPLDKIPPGSFHGLGGGGGMQ